MSKSPLQPPEAQPEPPLPVLVGAPPSDRRQWLARELKSGRVATIFLVGSAVPGVAFFVTLLVSRGKSPVIVAPFTLFIASLSFAAGTGISAWSTRTGKFVVIFSAVAALASPALLSYTLAYFH